MTPDRARRTRRALIAEAPFNMASAYASVGAIQTGAALWLGATTMQIGLFGSVGSLGLLLVVLAPYLVRMTGGCRRPVIIGLHVVRMAARVAIVIVMIARPAGAVWWLLALTGVVSTCHALYRPLIRAWMAAVVPEGRRPVFLGRRLSWSMLGAVAVPPAAGAAVDALGSSPGFAVVFAGGLLFAAAGLAMSCIAFDPCDRRLSRRSTVTGQVRRSLRFMPFRRLFLFQLVTHAGQASYQHLLDILFLRYLGLSYLVINVFVSLSKGSKGLSALLNGPLRRRFEALPLLKVAGTIEALAPLLLLAATPATVFLVPVALILYELAQGVFSVSEQTLSIKWASVGDQTADFSALALSNGFVGAIVPVVTAALLRGVGFDVQEQPLDPTPLLAIVAASAAVRVAAIRILPSRDQDVARETAAP